MACTPVNNGRQSTEINNKIEVLESRIILLEKENTRLRQEIPQQFNLQAEKLKKKTKAIQKSQLFFISEMEKLKEDIEILTSENEKLAKNISDNNKRFKRIQAQSRELLLTIDQINTYFKESIKLPVKRSKITSDKELKKDSDAEDLFKDIFSIFKSNKINSAAIKFDKFRKDYPDSIWADDALFYVGYIYLLNKKYESAAVSFFEMEKHFPKSERIPEVKWWLAVTLEKTGDVGAAMDTYTVLSQLSDNNRFSQKARKRLEELTDTGMSNDL